MEARLKKLRQTLIDQSLDAVLISSTPNIFYLTGYGGFVPEERDAYVLVTKQKGYIFTHALYAEAMAYEVPHLELVEITRDNPFPEIMKHLVKKNHIERLGFESTNLTVAEHQKLSTIEVSLKHMDLSQLRAIKEPEELEQIKKACALADVAFEYVLTKIKPGVTERAIENEFNRFFALHDATSSFRPVICFGKNASVPHHLSGETKLKETDVVLCDIGAKVNFYCSDISRTFFVGKPTDEQKKMFDLVYDVQQKSIKYIEEKLQKKETISAFDVDRFARDCFESKGYPSFPYSLGHGTALEVHETPLLNPRSKAMVESGMVFTLEPGIHIRGTFGARIEDMFAIVDNKLIKLTHSRNTYIQL